MYSVDELHASIAEWRKTVKRRDWEAAHCEEDEVLAMALTMISEGVENPSSVAKKALQVVEGDHSRWYA